MTSDTLVLNVRIAAHGEAIAPVRAKLAEWMEEAHFRFLLLGILGIVLLSPRFLLLGGYAFERYVIGIHTPRPQLAAWPYVPTLILPMAVCALLTCFADHRMRATALVGTALPLGLLYGYLDPPSLLLLGALALAAYGIAKLPLPRALSALLVAALSLTFLIGCAAWAPGSAAARIASAQTGLLPMLWYSVYQESPPRQRLTLRALCLYLSVRVFGGPIVSYVRLFATPRPEQVAAVRFAGLTAIYVAIAAAAAQAGVLLLQRHTSVADATGPGLLALSYADYVRYYCGIVVRINLVIGVLRLFGIPVRDNFDYWLLARTPNEHWQRWNLLFREWIITFVFFPIMRARRWLFAAIMASMLTSGALHVVPRLLLEGASVFDVVKSGGYWIVNGLAIYATIRFPAWFPTATARIRSGSSGWSVTGVLLTSSFYAVLHGLRQATSWHEMGRYVERLTTLSWTWPL